MALKCKCNRLLEVTQGDLNKKGDLVLMCEECERTYFIDLVEIDDLKTIVKNSGGLNIKVK